MPKIKNGYLSSKKKIETLNEGNNINLKKCLENIICHIGGDKVLCLLTNYKEKIISTKTTLYFKILSDWHLKLLPADIETIIEKHVDSCEFCQIFIKDDVKIGCRQYDSGMLRKYIRKELMIRSNEETIRSHIAKCDSCDNGYKMILAYENFLETAKKCLTK